MSELPERQVRAELPANISSDVRYLIMRSHQPGSDRLRDLRAVSLRLLMNGASPDEILAILSDDRWPISQAAKEAGDHATRSHVEWARKQVELKAQQKIATVAKKAHEAEEREPPDDEGELAGGNKDGKPFASPHNVRVVLRQLGAEVEYDEFANRLHLHVVGDRNKRWRGHNRDLDDAGLVALLIACEEDFGLRVAKDRFRDYVKNYAHRRRYHPVLEYLAGLKWDGKPRVGNWLHTYLSVADNDYSRAAGQLLLVAAVRRVRKPGEKFDEMLLLEGPQGGLKSATLRVLAVRDEWFTDDLPLGADSKLVLERTQGIWIAEAGELSGMSKRGVADLKQFLSRGHDEARLAYEALTTRRLRSFVIVGTTNDDKYLKDLTGNRRFWPVKVGKVHLDDLKRDVDQLWAEAAKLEAADAPSRLDPSLYDVAAREQAERLEDDPWAEKLGALLAAFPQARVRSTDVWAVLDKPTAQQTPQDGNRLHRLLKYLGFENKALKHAAEGNNKTVRCWVRGDGSQVLRAVASEPNVRRFALVSSA